MNLSTTRATFGLNSRATPVKAGTNGTVQIGENNETLTLSSATKIVSFDAVLAGTASLVVDVSDLDSTGTTSWTAGTAQVETATAAGTVSGTGNASVVVTSTGMTGSPLTVSVPVTSGDTASVWAGKVRTALAANATIAARFTVSGTTTSIVLTRKPLVSYTLNGSSVPVYTSTDASLNIALDNGTSTGITPASTSANTTAGTATAGVNVPDLDGTDFEGEATGGLTAIYGITVKNASTSAVATTVDALNSIVLPIGGLFGVGAATTLGTDDLTVTTASLSALVTVTIAGS